MSTAAHEQEAPEATAATPTVSSTSIASFTQTAADLATLRQRYANVVFDVRTPQGMVQAREARRTLQKLRTTFDKGTRVAEKSAALAYCRKVDEEANEIIGAIKELEQPIASQIEAEEERVAAEKATAALREQERVHKIDQAIGALQRAPARVIGATAEKIGAALAELQKRSIESDEFHERTAEALEAKRVAIIELDNMHTKQREAETNARELVELRRREQERNEREARERKAREERERAERECQEFVERSISALRQCVIDAAGASAATIASTLIDIDNASNPFPDRDDPARARWFQAYSETIDKLRTMHAQAIEREQRDARAAEEARQRQEREALIDEIGRLAASPMTLMSASSAEIARTLADLEAWQPDAAKFGALHGNIVETRAHVIASIRGMHKRAVESEAAQKELEERREAEKQEQEQRAPQEPSTLARVQAPETYRVADNAEAGDLVYVDPDDGLVYMVPGTSFRAGETIKRGDSVFVDASGYLRKVAA